MKKHIPNILTSIRLLFAISVPFLFYFNNHKLLIIFLFVAVLSDAIDGRMARNWNVVSEIGKLLDILSDKVLAFTTSISYIFFIDKIFILLFLGELLITSTTTFIYSTQKEKDTKKYNSSIYGKTKTIILFTTLFITYISFRFNILGFLILPLVIISFIAQLITAYTYYKIYKK